MRSLLEKAIVHLLNGDQDKAESLFHKFMVERARAIHEKLRQNDVQLTEGWDSEIREDEYFDDLEGDEEGGDDLGGVEDSEPVPAEGGADVDITAEEPPTDEFGGDEELGAEEMPGEGGDMASKLDDISAQMDELSAEFDRLMSKIEGGDLGLGDEEGMGDEEGLGDEGLGGDELGGELGGADEFSGEEGTETHDLADRFEDDMADQNPEEEEFHEEEEVPEDDEMMEDITESVLAELDKVAAPSNTEGKEVGSGGKTVSGERGDMLPHHNVKDRVEQAKPYLVKAQGDAHNDSFERESPPSSKKFKERRNNDAGVKKLKTVPKGGDSSAQLNHDFAEKKEGRPIIDGSKKVR